MFVTHQVEQIRFERKKLKDSHLLELYRAILLPRMIEEKMLLLLRQGKISKWFSGIGQEAISVGATLCLEEEEYILPMHRNLGVFTSRKVPLSKLFKQFQGKPDGFTKGRDRSFHFGTQEHNIVGMISHLGAQLGVADGIALGEKLANNSRATLVFTGEGGTSEGEFHEALNVAAVWDLPVLFLIENNGYGLSTPSAEQYRCKDLIDKGKGYGIKAKKIDGNNILEVYHEVSNILKEIRKTPAPFLLECETFRMRGHEEASGTKYVPTELMETWELKDPVINFREYLLSKGILTFELIEEIKTVYSNLIKGELEKAFNADLPQADTTAEINDVYKPFSFIKTSPDSNFSTLRLVDAISDGLKEAMKKHDNLILMGQDIAEYGGVFKVTDGFITEFGHERVRNTPITEAAILGTALGLSVKGYKSMVEMQFADFIACGFNQVVNNLAKVHYRWGQFADVVIRMPAGGGISAGPFHSQSNEAWFFHTPGLKIFYPSTPFDAKGLLLTAIEDPNPVLLFEHKALYRSVTGDVPEGYYNIEAGKARLVTMGDDVSIITYGSGVGWAEQTLSGMPDVKADLIDLRTLMPYDQDAIADSVKKTGKAILLHEDTLVGGVGGEIAAWIAENLFEYLDAPIIRSASLDTPVPFAQELETNFLASSRFKDQLLKLLTY